jgi:CDGSH-type Zn-finger protein
MAADDLRADAALYLKERALHMPKECGCPACESHALVRRLLERLDQQEQVIDKAHRWLETVDQNRTIVCRCGTRHQTYIGLHHRAGENVKGCEFCAALSAPREDERTRKT